MSRKERRNHEIGKVATARTLQTLRHTHHAGPLLAWNLIGRFRSHVPEWDLWWTSSDAVGDYEAIPFDNGNVREYRVYHRIFKRDLWFVGTRPNEYYERQSA